MDNKASGTSLATVRNTFGKTSDIAASSLTLIFVVLKLVGTITWSWWWVFSPLWISGLLAIFIVLIMLLYFLYKKPY